jgi:hypothetical protein
MSDDLGEWKDLYNKGYILEEKCDLCNREVPESQLTLLDDYDWVCKDCWWEAHEEGRVEE